MDHVKLVVLKRLSKIATPTNLKICSLQTLKSKENRTRKNEKLNIQMVAIRDETYPSL